MATVAVAPGLHVHPRDAWGADLPPRGPIDPEEVRFLLVHHTATPNGTSDVRSLIRSVYAYHTGPEKGWPDVAYQFFIAPDGSIWEGRAGSIAGPVVASATGGSQGWAQLVCLIGDHTTVPPTRAAQTALVGTLAWLRWRYRLPRDPSATTTIVSRGSDKHPVGTVVTTPLIAGHRDHTLTACPGEAAYRLLPTWRAAVAGVADPVFPRTGPHPPARRLGVTRH